jgi:transcriptional regulator with XRE-family HTH domain
MGIEVVSSIFNVSKKLFEKLQKRSYRQAYLAEHVRRGISYQIRALRGQRKWNQGEFSKRLGKPQSVVSRLEDPNYGKVTIQTLLEIADIFDVALQVRFVTYSSFIQQTRDISVASLQVAQFNEDLGMHANRVLTRQVTGTAGEAISEVIQNWPEEYAAPGPNRPCELSAAYAYAYA